MGQIILLPHLKSRRTLLLCTSASGSGNPLCPRGLGSDSLSSLSVPSARPQGGSFFMSLCSPDPHTDPSRREGECIFKDSTEPRYTTSPTARADLRITNRNLGRGGLRLGMKRYTRLRLGMRVGLRTSGSLLRLRLVPRLVYNRNLARGDSGYASAQDDRGARR